MIRIGSIVMIDGHLGVAIYVHNNFAIIDEGDGHASFVDARDYEPCDASLFNGKNIVKTTLKFSEASKDDAKLRAMAEALGATLEDAREWMRLWSGADD